MKVTAERLVEHFRVDMATAERVVRIIRGDEDPSDVEATARWIRDCYHRPPQRDLIMHAANDLLEGCGVEGKCTSVGKYVYSYVNLGDTYAITLIHDWRGFGLRCWGDMEGG